MDSHGQISLSHDRISSKGDVDMRNRLKFISLFLIFCLLFCCAACSDTGTAQPDENGNPISGLTWGMTKEDAEQAVPDASWQRLDDVLNEQAYLLTWEQPIWGVKDFSARGTEKAVEVRFTGPFLVDGQNIPPVLSRVTFNFEDSGKTCEDLKAALTKAFGEPTTSQTAGSTVSAWYAGEMEQASSRVSLTAALLATADFTGYDDLQAYCDATGVEGLFPYEASACEATWETWKNAFPQGLGPTVTVTEKDGTVTVLCEGQAQAFLPFLVARVYPES